MGPTHRLPDPLCRGDPDGVRQDDLPRSDRHPMAPTLVLARPSIELDDGRGQRDVAIRIRVDLDTNVSEEGTVGSIQVSSLNFTRVTADRVPFPSPADFRLDLETLYTASRRQSERRSISRSKRSRNRSNPR